MSVPATGGVPTSGAGEGEKEAVELPLHGDAAFAGLMDALAPEPEGGEAAPAAGGSGTAADPAAAGGTDTGGAGDAAAQRPTAGDPAVAGAADGAAGTEAPGADGAAAGDPADAAAAGGGADQRPADWTASAADLIPKLGELSTKLEESTQQAYQQRAYEEVRKDHEQYFAALDQHPRLLVGKSVPAIGKEGMETLRDSNDAREWQEAVKSILVAEIKDRAGRQMEESKDFLETVHASIDLFKNNDDLVPGTKEFDRELADQFAELAKPYELRVDGKLQGYSIPVQPIIDQLRTRLTATRAAAQTAAPAATPAAPAAAPPNAGAAPPAAQATPDPPQAGITSKAGNSGEKEDFSTLFGTIGLPNLQI